MEKSSLNEKQRPTLWFIKSSLFSAEHKDQSHTWPHIFKDKKERNVNMWVGWKWCNVPLVFYCSSREALFCFFVFLFFFSWRHFTFRKLICLLPSRGFHCLTLRLSPYSLVHHKTLNPPGFFCEDCPSFTCLPSNRHL